MPGDQNRNRTYFDVSSVRRHKILVNETSRFPNPGFGRINTATTADLRIIETLLNINNLRTSAHTFLKTYIK